MLHGTYSIPGVIEESLCRNSKSYRFTDIGVYQIHSTSLMPNIPFEASSIQPKPIDSSIFINDEETKLDFEYTIQCQNFLTTRYIGRAPLEWYEGEQMTSMGRQFILICRNGNPKEEYRVFGTEAAIRGYNKNASEITTLPGGGEQY